MYDALNPFCVSDLMVLVLKCSEFYGLDDSSVLNLIFSVTQCIDIAPKFQEKHWDQYYNEK